MPVVENRERPGGGRIGGGFRGMDAGLMAGYRVDSPEIHALWFPYANAYSTIFGRLISKAIVKEATVKVKLAPKTVVRDNYNKISKSYADMYEGGGPLAHFYQMRLKILDEWFAYKPAGVLLDVGAGPGIVGDQMRKLGFRYVTADQSIGMAQQCRARSNGTGEVVVASADALPFSAGVFDVVTALGVLEYLHAPEAGLKECRRVLRRDGTFVVSLLHNLSPFRVLQRLRYGLGMDPDPIQPAHFSGEQARRMLASAGFEIQAIRYFDFELLPLEIGQRHPRWSDRLAQWAERGWSGPMRWIGSAFLIEARAA